MEGMKMSQIENSPVINLEEGKSETDRIHKISSTTRFLDSFLENIAIYCLIISTSLSIFSVIMRYSFGLSYEIVEELCRYSILYGVFAYVGPLIKKNEHIKMDLMDSLLKGRAKETNELFISILLMTGYAFLFWSGSQWVASLYQMGIRTSSGAMLMVIPAFSIPLGMFLACIYSIQQVIMNILQFGKSKSR
jgi:TRAP-type C4-dicarboxylate transport system permease small subunit